VFPRIEHGATTVNDKSSWASILFGYPIITFPHVADITPKKYDVEFVNENYYTINFNTDADIIGVTCYTMTEPHVYEIAYELRRRGKIVVLGGFRPTAMPEESIEHTNSIVIGMAEANWPRLLDDFEKGKLKRIYEKNPNYKAGDIPPIDRDLIRHNPIIGSVQTTRGCPNRYEFCAIASFCQHGIKQRPIKNVIEEIKQMQNNLLTIHDLHLNANPKYAKKIFKEMIKNKINKSWVSNGTTNVLLKVDGEFLFLARKSGYVEGFVGFETVSQAALNGVKKTHNKVENFKKRIDRVHKHGMSIQGGIIFGFDEDTTDVFDATLKKINELEIDVLEINILTPYPGTPLSERLEKEGHIFTKYWSKYNQVDVVFEPKNMILEELINGTKKVAKEFYSWYNIIRRNTRILTTVRRIGAMLPIGTNITFRRYYKNDFNI